MQAEIIRYIKSYSRNKIVIHKEAIEGVWDMDLGLELAKELQSISIDRRYAFKVQSKLNKLLNNSIKEHPEYGQVLSLYNLGILFEPESKVNFYSLIEKYSKDLCLFIRWDGEINNNKLYFLSKEKGIKINIKNLSHIVI